MLSIVTSQRDRFKTRCVACNAAVIEGAAHSLEYVTEDLTEEMDELWPLLECC